MEWGATMHCLDTTAMLHVPDAAMRAPSQRPVIPVIPVGEVSEAARSACITCLVRHVCVPSWSASDALAPLQSTPIARRRLRKGQAVFREGDRCDYVYAVRFGSLKSVANLYDNREQVMSFHLPGELFGFDGLATGKQPSTACALEDAEVCVLPYALLIEAAGASSSVLHHLTITLCAELLNERRVAALIANTRSEERVAAFLLNLSQRLHERGYSSRAFQLRMTREEIGSYLGATLETVSRCLSSLSRQGFVNVHRREIEIVDPDGLRAHYAAGN